LLQIQSTANVIDSAHIVSRRALRVEAAE
jgi:hypothetical protein